MASMKDVAQKAGVSKATVSHVINGTRFVSEKTKSKVRKAMDDLNYHPNFAARSLRSQQSRIIGFLVPDVTNYFFINLVKGIEGILRENGYHLLVSNSDDNLETEKWQLKVFNGQMIDGLIMASTAHDHSFLDEYINYPVIFIDRKPNGYNKGDCILVKNEEGTYQAIKALIDKGHKRIGFISGLPGLTTTVERIDGYKKALTDNGMKIDEKLIQSGDSRLESGFDLTGKLLKNTDITVLFVANNMMMEGTMKYIKEKKVKIPEDIAIMAFDDKQWFSFTNPSVSAVKQPSSQIGKRAAKLLLQRIKGEEKGDYREERFETEVIIRESC